MVKIATIVIALLAFEIVSALPGKCGHTAWQNFTVPRRRLQRLNETVSSVARGVTWSPIRIQVYWGPLSISSSVEARLRAAVKGAVNWYQKVLSVQPVSSSWKVDSGSCGTVDFSGSITTDSFTADYVFFVTADSLDNGLAGAAMYCQQDETTGQPVLGSYYFNGKFHETASDEQVLSTTIHEMTHALGFSPGLYNQFLRGDGSHYVTSDVFITETVRGHTVLKLAFPTALSKARAGFGCSSLNGIELEGQGDQGTVGAHWEKRVMYTDYMVADADVYDIAYTDVTVGLFKDMGWYDVSYTYTNPISWGYHRGCSFISQKCIVNSEPITTDFCVDQTRAPACDFEHIRKGTCNLSTFTQSLPSEYQYFTSPAMGGSDAYIDFCPIVKPYTNGDCRDPTTVLLSQDYGEEAGYDARCVSGTYSKSGNTMEHVGCHKVSCSGTTATVTIGGIQVVCPSDGGDVTVTGFSGVVHCPPNAALCATVPCVNDCKGLGYCSNSVCVCDDGSSSCQTPGISSSGATVLQLGLALLLLAS